MHVFWALSSLIVIAIIPTPKWWVGTLGSTVSHPANISRSLSSLISLPIIQPPRSSASANRVNDPPVINSGSFYQTVGSQPQTPRSYAEDGREYGNDDGSIGGNLTISSTADPIEDRRKRGEGIAGAMLFGLLTAAAIVGWMYLTMRGKR
jgi:hypothetical protein